MHISFFAYPCCEWSMTLHPLVHDTVCWQPWSSFCHFFRLGLDKCRKFEVFMQNNMESIVFWDVMSCILADRYQPSFWRNLPPLSLRALNFQALHLVCAHGIFFKEAVSQNNDVPLYYFSSSIHCMFHLLWGMVRWVNMRMLDGLLCTLLTTS